MYVLVSYGHKSSHRDITYRILTATLNLRKINTAKWKDTSSCIENYLTSFLAIEKNTSEQNIINCYQVKLESTHRVQISTWGVIPK